MAVAIVDSGEGRLVAMAMVSRVLLGLAGAAAVADAATTRPNICFILSDGALLGSVHRCSVQH
jgi:ABC-type sugar transport system substrate-binding protein